MSQLNLSLLDPHQTGFPNHIVATSSVANITSVAYSRLGTYLAAGRKQGDICIFANDSFTPLFRLQGHSAKITSLCFSCDNSRLVSGSYDGQVLVWDLSTQKPIHHFRLQSPIVQVLMYPNNNLRMLVLSHCLEPVEIELNETLTWSSPTGLDLEQISKLEFESKRWIDQLFNFTSAAFDPTAQYLLLATRGGLLVVYSLAAKRIVRIDHNSRTPILQIKFGANPQDILLNCSTYLKVIEMKAAGTQVSFGYAVKCSFPSNGGHWTKCAFDLTGELIIGSHSGQPDHCLHVFERSGGDPHSTLLGPGDQILDLAWNPRQSSLVSVEGSGTICLWAPLYRQCWSGWAPSFREFDTNCPLEEEEDTFDLDYASPSHSIHRPASPPPPAYVEDVTVDITGDMPESFLEQPLFPKPSPSHELPPFITIDCPSGTPRQASPKHNPRPLQPAVSHQNHAPLPRPATRHNGWSDNRRHQSRERKPYGRPQSPGSRRSNNPKSPSCGPKVFPLPSDADTSSKRRRQYTSHELPRPKRSRSPTTRSRNRHDSINHYSPYSRHSSTHSTNLGHRSSQVDIDSSHDLYPQHHTRFGSASLASPKPSNNVVYDSPPPPQIDRANKYQKRESRYSRSPRHPYRTSRAPPSRRPEAPSESLDVEEGEIIN
ncbi:hypothetical protein DSO57_1036616 [Entomophthora muscae]|uniref:Uncharacterized protein n=2 Tax=Entomophthora muscae TaxID=34485 RepID=A0ACC2SCB0_9FUNG|nr:hypothetical protein DSO57_1036616 [Entomophthora muscae]